MREIHLIDVPGGDPFLRALDAAHESLAAGRRVEITNREGRVVRLTELCRKPADFPPAFIGMIEDQHFAVIAEDKLTLVADPPAEPARRKSGVALRAVAIGKCLGQHRAVGGQMNRAAQEPLGPGGDHRNRMIGGRWQMARRVEKHHTRQVPQLAGCLQRPQAREVRCSSQHPCRDIGHRGKQGIYRR